MFHISDFGAENSIAEEERANDNDNTIDLLSIVRCFIPSEGMRFYSDYVNTNGIFSSCREYVFAKFFSDPM